MIKNGKLSIFENFQIDTTLSKHLESQNSQIVVTTGLGFSRSLNNGNNIDVNLEYLEYLNKNSYSLFTKFKLWLYKKIYGNIFNLKIKKTISVLELQKFFDNLKSNTTKLNQSDINEVIRKFDSVLTNAKNNKQIALVEKLENYIEVLKYELILSNSKFNKFLEEKDVVNFHQIASKHDKYQTKLCLTYVKNFIKIIPNEIIDLKIESEKLNVFDNYVILHYDYDDSAVEDTKEEKERKKDPILFGIISGSTRLYYIGDWIDDYCDLTLDVLIKTIGIEEKELNKETIIDGL